MPKTKERVAEKPAAKASTRAAAVKTTPPAKASSRVAAAPVTAKGAASRVAASAKIVEPPASKVTNGKSSSKLSATKLSVVTKGAGAKPATDRSERAERHDKPERSERAEKAERSDKAEKVEKIEKPVVQYKCPFAKDELLKWRQQLLFRRNEISTDIAGLEKDAMEAEDGHTTPNHIAERGSDADLQDVSLGIAGEEKDIIWQIDRALRKIDEHQPLPYGLCEYTKEAIPRNRLQLIPWTPLSIEGANHMEQNNIQVEDMLVDG
jgi:DnaK suppressor protein